MSMKITRTITESIILAVKVEFDGNNPVTVDLPAVTVYDEISMEDAEKLMHKKHPHDMVKVLSMQTITNKYALPVEKFVEIAEKVD